MSVETHSDAYLVRGIQPASRVESRGMMDDVLRSLAHIVQVSPLHSSILSEEDVILDLTRPLRVDVLGVSQDLVFPGLSIHITAYTHKRNGVEGAKVVNGRAG